jgi:hypothetical protein
MVVAYGVLREIVAVDLRDPDALTFDLTAISDFIQAAATEVGMIAPEYFQEDITPVDAQLEYQLREDVFDQPVPEIEVKRVEVWDGTQTPMQYVARLKPKSESRLDTSFNGWEVWNGMLQLTNGMERDLDPDVHLIRVWGWSPYPIPSDEEDFPTWSNEIEQAIRTYCRIAAMELLLADRNLFSQWQTRSGNTDMSPAGLMNELVTARSMWRSKSRALGRLRTAN